MRRFPEIVAVLPVWRHVVTCISCGFREATHGGQAYAERCPYDGLPLDHYETEITTREELAAIERRPRQRRLAAMAGDLRG